MGKATIPIPKECVGMVIGKGGKSIKELKSTVGIKSLYISNSNLTMHGSEFGINLVKQKVRNLIENAIEQSGRVHGYVPSFSAMVLACQPNDYVTLNPTNLENQYTLRFVEADRDSESDDLAETMEKLHISTNLFFLGEMAYIAKLVNYIEGLDSLDQKNLRLAVEFGKSSLVTKQFSANSLKAQNLFNSIKSRMQFTPIGQDTAAFEEFLNKEGKYQLIHENKVDVAHLVHIPSNTRKELFLRTTNDEFTSEWNIWKKIIAEVLQSNNYYDLFSLARSFSDAELKISFLILKKKVHPKDNLHPESIVALKIVENAYEILSNKILRQEYDEKLKKSESKVRDELATALLLHSTPPIIPYAKKYVFDTGREAIINLVAIDPPESNEVTFDSRLMVRKRCVSLVDQTPERLQQYSEAWDKASGDFIDPITNETLQIKLVRYRTIKTYSDGHFKITMKKVINTETPDQTIWTVTLSSYGVKEMIASGNLHQLQHEIELLVDESNRVIDWINQIFQ